MDVTVGPRRRAARRWLKRRCAAPSPPPPPPAMRCRGHSYGVFIGDAKQLAGSSKRLISRAVRSRTAFDTLAPGASSRPSLTRPSYAHHVGNMGMFSFDFDSAPTRRCRERRAAIAPCSRALSRVNLLSATWGASDDSCGQFLVKTPTAEPRQSVGSCRLSSAAIPGWGSELVPQRPSTILGAMAETRAGLPGIEASLDERSRGRRSP